MLEKQKLQLLNFGNIFSVFEDVSSTCSQKLISTGGFEDFKTDIINDNI